MTPDAKNTENTLPVMALPDGVPVPEIPRPLIGGGISGTPVRCVSDTEGRTR